ncbi:MAG: acyltransferase [Bacillus sp. (in: firmicutes)]
MKQIKRFLKKPLLEKFQSISFCYWKIKTKMWYKLYFNEIGRNSIIIKPLKLTNVKNIKIKENVRIDDYTWLLTLQVKENAPELIIENNTNIGHFNHITCVDKVHIGQNVLTADKVYISDNYHDYENINIPINDQEVKSKKRVYIGDNTWIGENVSIISCSIGRNCVIGANSVVTKDIPDYCIAVGSPARVIKKYNFETKKWEITKERKQ